MRRRLVLAGLALALLPASAQAQDLNAELAEAQAQEAEAQATIAAVEPQVEATEGELLPIATKTREGVARANSSLERIDRIEEDLIAQREDGAQEVAALEAGYREDKDEHDESTETALGFGLGAALLALIPFFWGRFRELSPVRRLSGLGFGSTLAWVGGGTFVGLLIDGTLLGTSGVAYVLGGTLTCLTIGLAAALLIARHSLRVESGESTPLLSRARLPRWAALALAVLLLVLGVGALGDGLLSSGPDEPEISDDLRQLADAAANDPAEPASEQLLAARETAEPLVAAAEKLREPFHDAKRAWSEAKNQLVAAKDQLREAQGDVSRLTSKIEAEAEQAALAAARAAAKAERQAARQAVAAPVPGGGGGTPSYSSCDTAPDNIPVAPGSDLDADGDGIGCET